MQIREHCPVCGATQSRFVVRMTNEYLLGSDEGWQYDHEELKLAGLDLEQDGDRGPSYEECSSCGTFFLRELYDVESAYQELRRREPEESEIRYQHQSDADVYGRVGTADLVARMISLALRATGGDGLKVLDYGCGGGDQLTVMRALGVDGVVGYDLNDSRFGLIRRYFQPNIVLTTNREELAKEGPFDAIWCNAVLEHVFEPAQIVDHIHDLLKDSGIAYFYAPSVGRRTMAGYKRLVENGTKVKRLHPGHIQIWNADTLPLSKFVERKGFKILPVVPGLRMRDTTTVRGLVRSVAANAYRSLRAIGDAGACRIGRHKFSSFFARKVARTKA